MMSEAGGGREWSGGEMKVVNTTWYNDQLYIKVSLHLPYLGRGEFELDKTENIGFNSTVNIWFNSNSEYLVETRKANIRFKSNRDAASRGLTTPCGSENTFSDLPIGPCIGYPRTKTSSESSTTIIDFYMHCDLTQSRHLMTLTESIMDNPPKELTSLQDSVSSLDLKVERIKADTDFTRHSTMQLRRQLKTSVDGLEIKIDLLESTLQLVDEVASLKSQVAEMVDCLKELRDAKMEGPSSKKGEGMSCSEKRRWF
ncbi:hypothetical protein F511_16110 [Dorcoceras hygrometricum]|uniref:Uncharacterized protein n=1 Tax=Dorcoceras hygrometricum TaxID=472368 RepID=A0A2Z7CVU1_9LAMI|nr:hypothetical protein F511_16110 [Dorcoceras hygrometricum]